MTSRQIMEFTEYESPDGLIYSFDTQDRFLMTEAGLGMPPIKYITQTRPDQHGETILDYRLQPRIIQLIHRHNSCSRASYWSNRANLLNLIRPNRQITGQFALGHLRKVLPDGTTYQIDVMIDSGPEFAARSLQTWDEWSFTETLRFRAPDPVFYNPTQVCVTIGFVVVTDHLIFPFTFRGVIPKGFHPSIPDSDYNPYGTDLQFTTNLINISTNVTYTGTWMSFPTIQITGPMGEPEIVNATTGEKIKLLYNVAGGEVVTIGLQYGNKYVTNQAGVNLIGSVSTDSDLSTFHIEPEPGATGGVNVIQCSASGGVPGTSQVALAYYTRYIGI